MTDSIETTKDLGTDDAALARRWTTEIQLYEKKFQAYGDQCKKIIRRYRDDRDANQSSQKRFNLLWSNIETLKPSIYTQPPKASVGRRFKDDDPVGRVASEVLERAINYMLTCHSGFDDVMAQCRDDYLIVGRSISWQRYVPHFRDVTIPAQPEDVAEEGAQIDNLQDDSGPESASAESAETYQEVEFEEIIDDYISWSDWGHNAGARIWAEVYAVWRRAYLTRDELIERFGDEIGKKVPLDFKPEGLNEKDRNYELFKKATVYEIWDKSSKKALWLHKEYKEGPLDVRDDPLRLSDFFPCPKPLFSTLTNDSLIPIPDFVQYQDQAEEIDALTQRIAHLTGALKVRGLYAGEITEIKRLFQDGNDLDLIPVQNWAMYAEKGGLDKAISWVPLKDIASALIQLYEARDKAKSDLYEVTGLSDIIRGASDPNETATAQGIKAQWGSIRVRGKQTEVARFARDMIRIKAEIIAEHFSADTIKMMADADEMRDAMQPIMGPPGQVDPMTGQPAPPQPVINPQTGQPLTVLDQAIELLKSDSLRSWRIDIESDSTVSPDENAEKQKRNEFLQAISSFVQAWGPIIREAPAMATLAGELLKFAVRGYKTAASLESVIDKAMEQMEAPPPPPTPTQPDPNVQIKAQTDQAKVQVDAAKVQAENQRSQTDQQIAMTDLAMQAHDMRHRHAMDQANLIQPPPPPGGLPNV